MAALERRYRYVVYDTPPCLLVPDANLILAEVPSFVTVARSGSTRVRAFQQMLDLLPEERFLGPILNEASLPRHAREYGPYYQADIAPGKEK